MKNKSKKKEDSLYKESIFLNKRRNTFILFICSFLLTMYSCQSPKDKILEKLELIHQQVCITDKNFQDKDKEDYINEFDLIVDLLRQYRYEGQEAKKIGELIEDCSNALSSDVNYPPGISPVPSWRKADVYLYSEDEILLANTAKDVTYLTEKEKEIIMLFNLARYDGRKFINQYLNQWLKDKSVNDYRYIVSLYEDLYKTSDLSMLKPSEILYNTARNHAIDMGKFGMTGHDSSDGTTYEVRITAKYGEHIIGENCAYGTNNAIDIVISMLIDEGDKGYVQRRNILSKQYDQIGVSIQPHNSDFKYNCVQDFGSSK